MKLIEGLKFTQDRTINCEVIRIYTNSRRTAKSVIKSATVDILKNGVMFTYDLKCFQESFNNSSAFKIIKNV